METVKISPEWCMEFSKKLAAFNKAFLFSKGNGVARNVILHGTKQAVQYCAEKEAELFYAEGIFENDKVIYELESNEKGVYLFHTYDNTKASLYKKHYDNGNVCIFSGGEDKMPFALKNVFDIDGCEIITFIAQIKEKSGLTEINDLLMKKMLEDRPEWEKYKNNVALFINNMLLCHFEYYDDIVFHESDVDWLYPEDIMETKIKEHILHESPVEHIQDKNSEMHGESSIILEEKNTDDSASDIQIEDKIIKTDVPDEENGKAEKNANENIQTKPDVNNLDENKTEKVSLITHSTDKNENKSSMAEPYKEMDDNNQVSGMDGQTEYKSLCLSEADTRKNEEIIQELESLYLKCERALDKIGSSQFRNILSTIRQDREERSFDDQAKHCRMYLEITDDTKLPEYKLIYDLDRDSAKIIRDAKKLYAESDCINCGTHWVDDITFKKEGFITVACPKCGAKQQKYREKPKA